MTTFNNVLSLTYDIPITLHIELLVLQLHANHKKVAHSVHTLSDNFSIV